MATLRRLTAEEQKTVQNNIPDSNKTEASDSSKEAPSKSPSKESSMVTQDDPNNSDSVKGCEDDDLSTNSVNVTSSKCSASKRLSTLRSATKRSGSTPNASKLFSSKRSSLKTYDDVYIVDHRKNSKRLPSKRLVSRINEKLCNNKELDVNDQKHNDDGSIRCVKARKG